jgi:hypothetical protein
VGCSVAALLSSAGALAAPRADVYRLTVSGRVSAQWDHTGVPTADGACTRTFRTEGIRSVRFRSRPTLVRLIDGRLQGVTVRGIGGTVTLAGAETTDTKCPDGTGTSQVADCVTTRRSFAAGTLRLRSPARGRLAFGTVRARLAIADCPNEIAPVRQAPAGASPTTIRLPIAKLSHPGTRGVTSRVSFRQNDTFGPPEDGALQQRVVWTLTFKRVKT